MPRQTLSDSECKKLPGRPVQLPIVRMRGRGGRRVAAEGKDQVGPSPEQVSGWKPGKGVPSPFHALISGAGRKPSRGPAPQVPQETLGGAEAHMEGRHGIL